MAAPTRRRFWQLRLSTAVVLMVVAAALISFNAEIDRENNHPLIQPSLARLLGNIALDGLNIVAILVAVAAFIETLHLWRAEKNE